MVVALYDVWKCEYAERVECRPGLAQPTAARRRLIEDEGKSAVEPANGDQRWHRCFDVGRAGTRWNDAKVSSTDRSGGQTVVRSSGIDDREPNALGLEARDRLLDLGKIADSIHARIGIGSPRLPA